MDTQVPAQTSGKFKLKFSREAFLVLLVALVTGIVGIFLGMYLGGRTYVIETNLPRATSTQSASQTSTRTSGTSVTATTTTGASTSTSSAPKTTTTITDSECGLSIELPIQTTYESLSDFIIPDFDINGPKRWGASVDDLASPNYEKRFLAIYSAQGARLSCGVGCGGKSFLTVRCKDTNQTTEQLAQEEVDRFKDTFTLVKNDTVTLSKYQVRRVEFSGQPESAGATYFYSIGGKGYSIVYYGSEPTLKGAVESLTLGVR